jgi:ribosomal protein S21
MVVIQKGKGESKDNIFRKFSKIFFEENIVNDLRKRQFYKKPSLVRREEEKERLANRKKSFKLTTKSFKK